MDQTKQEPTAAVVAEAKQKLGTIAAVEAVINEWTRGQARKMGIRETCFRVHLVEDLSRGDLMILGGPTVQIQLKWPMQLGLAKSKLTDALSLIRKRGLYTPLEIATKAYFQSEGAAARKWTDKSLEKIGVHELVKELIPMQRVRVTRSVTVTYTDTLTGAAISYTESAPPTTYQNESINEWLNLSRVVNAHSHAIAERADGVGQGTPDSIADAQATSEASGSEAGISGATDDALLEDDADGGAE